MRLSLLAVPDRQSAFVAARAPDQKIAGPRGLFSYLSFFKKNYFGIEPLPKILFAFGPGGRIKRADECPLMTKADISLYASDLDQGPRALNRTREAIGDGEGISPRACPEDVMLSGPNKLRRRGRSCRLYAGAICLIRLSGRDWPSPDDVGRAMSALPPIADILYGGRNVRFVPEADIQPSLTKMYTLR